MSPRWKKQLSTWWVLRNIEFRDTPPAQYVDALGRDEYFSFARYGDGEWSAILGKPGGNCDGHEYFPELRERLAAAVRTPRGYYYALQRHAMRTLGFKIVSFLKKNRVDLVWHNSDVFHYANRDGLLNPFIRQLRGKDVVVVGPPYLRALRDTAFKYAEFIEIPLKNCFLDARRIQEKIVSWGHARSGVVYSFSASMAANVMIHELFPVLGGKNWLLDLGALWDVYVGVKSRTFYTTRDWAPILERNLARNGAS